MWIIDKFCTVLGGLSVACVGLSFMWVLWQMIFTGEFVMPPSTIFMGLFGTLAAMFIYAGCHLIKGDLFN